MPVFPSPQHFTRLAALVAFIVLVLVGIAASGCAHMRPASCADVLRTEISGCVPAGQQFIADDDGFGIAVFAACGIGSPNPIVRAVVIIDSPTRTAKGLKAGARDAGTCAHGDYDRRVLVLEQADPDLRTSK